MNLRIAMLSAIVSLALGPRMLGAYELDQVWTIVHAMPTLPEYVDTITVDVPVYAANTPFYLTPLALRTAPRVVDADGAEGTDTHGGSTPSATATTVRLASWWSRKPMMQAPGTARIFGFATGAPARAVVTFSPGASVGKGIYEIRVALCNPNPALQVAIDAGWIEGAAAANGISRADDSEAAYANDLQRNRSKPIIGTQAIQGGLEIGTGVIAMRSVAASSAWGAGFVFGSIAARYLVSYLKSVTVPDFKTRFDDTRFVDGTYTLPPQSCAKKQIMFSHTLIAGPISNVPIY